MSLDELPRSAERRRPAAILQHQDRRRDPQPRDHDQSGDQQEEEPHGRGERRQQADQDHRPEPRQAEPVALGHLEVSAEERAGGRARDRRFERRVHQDPEHGDEQRPGDREEQGPFDDDRLRLADGDLDVVDPPFREQDLRDRQRHHDDRDEEDQVGPVEPVQGERVGQDLADATRSERARIVGARDVVVHRSLPRASVAVAPGGA
jgi:hypothetical protein